MLRGAKYVGVVVAVLAIALLAKAGIPAVAIGTWQSAGQMTEARAGAASVLLPDGRIMFIGGTDANGNPLATTEFFDTNGNFVPGPTMNVARTGHAAMWLANGEVLVTGGTTSAAGMTPPAATNSAEVFDPLYPQDGWKQLAPMPNARTGHTATMLQDGSVLIAGGENSGGPVSGLDILEIAPGDHFVSIGSMLRPRRGHAAAALRDGRVLIIGGADANGATLASTEIFNPAALADTTLPLVTAGPSLTTPRSGATATSLIDGRVLVAGGSYPEAVMQKNPDGSTTQAGPAELATMEIYDPVADTLTTSALIMSTARSGHQAFLLPNNNHVLFVGGTFNGQALASVDLYSSWQNTLVATSAMANARAEATGSAMIAPQTAYPVSGVDGMLLIAGGSNQPTAELYGFATVKTDRTDYAPGEVVTITGTGWTPFETVTLKLVESPNIDAPGPFTVTADASGNITDSEFAPDANDFNVRFYLTAVGSTSGLQAQNSFTDKTINTDLSLSLPKTFIKYGNSSVVLTAILTEHQSGNPVAGKTIDITRSPGTTAVCSATTNPSGVATCTFDTSSLSENLYSIKANFAGNSTYGGSNTSQNLYVDGTAPDTNITSNPSNPSNSSSASFSFSGTDNYAPNTGNVLTFECKLDAGSFSTCTSPQSYSSLADGSHTFQVRAIDSAGNVDLTPASYTWTINTDSIAPTTTATPSGTSGNNGWYTSDVQVAFNSSDNTGGSGVKQITYSATGAQPISSTTVSGSSASFTINTEGTTTISYSALDNAGNSESAKTLTIKVDKTKPSISLGNCTGTLGAFVNGTQWYTSAVSCAFTANDAVSGLADTSKASFNVTSGTGEGTSVKISSGQVCDAAGNCADPISSGAFAIELTGPQITIGASSPSPNGNGWINKDVNVQYSVSTPVSGIDTNKSSANPLVITQEGSGVTGTITVYSLAGNSASKTTEAFNIDKTKPALTAGACTGTKGNDVGGTQWYLSAVSCLFTATDATSGLADTSKASFSVGTGTQEGNAISVASGQVCDKADNCADSLSSGPFAIELNGPQISFGSQSPAANQNGWNNSDVSFTYSVTNSPVSGIDSANSTSSPVIISTEGKGVTGSVTVRTLAGNVLSTATPAVNLDKTPPTITYTSRTAPNGEGWNNTDVAVNWSCTDALSGAVSTTVSQTVASEGSNQSATGTCHDLAGNTASDSQTGINIDKTAPTIVISPDRDPDHNGWYNHPATFSSSKSNDSLSGIAQCDPDVAYSTDNASASLTFHCTDRAGNTGSGTVNFKYDATPPTGVSGAPNRVPDHNGWYNTSVEVDFNGTDSVAGIASCSKVGYSGPNSTIASVQGTCTDNAGNTSSLVNSQSFQYDGTAPTNVALSVTAGTPGTNGWYTSPVTVHTSGMFSISGGGCTPDQSQTTETKSATFNGSCESGAGLTTNAAPLIVMLDMTPPTLTCVSQPPFILNQPNPTVSANVTDPISGPLATVVSTTVTDGTVGAFNTMLTGYDMAGLHSTTTCGYSVAFGNAIGFFQPWAAPPGTAFKAGSTIPLKWQWTDYYGKVVNSSMAVPDVYQHTWCVGSASAPVIDLNDAGTSGYQYDSTTYTWQYNWKTPKNGGGLCYALNVKAQNASGFVDGDKAVQLR